MPAPAQVTLPSDCEIRVTRQFNLPRQLICDAHTTPEMVQIWQCGYPGWNMPVCQMDVRVGGKYKWRWRNQGNDNQFGFVGVFTEVNPPSRLAHDESYDPGDVGNRVNMSVGDPCMVSLDLSEHDDATTPVCTMKFASQEARDGAVATGMTDGMVFSYARLDELIAKHVP